ncbi:MAG TPA: hypothetical protein VIQ24_12210, partial [Pyrinomonadaceae bacterium]
MAKRAKGRKDDRDDLTSGVSIGEGGDDTQTGGGGGGNSTDAQSDREPVADNGRLDAAERADA